MTGLQLTGEQQQRELRHLEAKEALFTYLAEKNAETIDDFLMYYKWQSLLDTCNQEQYRTYYEAWNVHKKLIEDRRKKIEEAKEEGISLLEIEERQRHEKARKHQVRQEFVDKRNQERIALKPYKAPADDLPPPLISRPVEAEHKDLEIGAMGSPGTTGGRSFKRSSTLASEFPKATKRRRKLKMLGSEKEKELLISKVQLVCLMIVALLTPAVVLFIQGQNERSECDTEKNSCRERCTELFTRENPQFASEFIPLKDCKVECEDKADTCIEGTRAILGAALALFAGLGVTLCIIYLMQTMMAENEENIAAVASKQPRPAYAEPNQTEEERVKAIEKKQKDPIAWNYTEARCLDCKIPVVVDVHWLPDRGCLKGGMKSAICHRCRKPVVGIL
jgi:hypothetical protein